jgi:hypothetical protein
MSLSEESTMTRLHRIVPTVAATLATAALLAPVAQARPAVSGAASGGGNASTVARTIHDQPLANPVSVPASGLNHGAGLTIDRTRSTSIDSSTSTDWVAVFTGATVGALVIAMCAAGIGIIRRANPAT